MPIDCHAHLAKNVGINGHGLHGVVAPPPPPPPPPPTPPAIFYHVTGQSQEFEESYKPARIWELHVCTYIQLSG